MKNFFCFLIVILCTIETAKANPMSPQVFKPFDIGEYDVRVKNNPKIALSNNGKLKAYLRHDGNNQSIIIESAVSQKQLHRLTMKDYQIDGLYFVNNTHLILDQTDNKADQYNETLQKHKIAHVYNIKTGKLFQLLNPHLRSIPVQPILNRIVGVTDNGNYAFMPAYDNFGRYNLYKVNLNSKRSPRLHHQGIRQRTNYDEYTSTLKPLKTSAE